MMKHYFRVHPGPKKIKEQAKGKQKKKYIFHPPRRK